MTWRDLLNVQNVEKGFFRSSNSYGIPDIRKDEFDIKELIPYRVDKNRKGTAHFFLDDYRFERCWKWADSQIPELRKYDGVLSPDFSMYTTYPIAINKEKTMVSCVQLDGFDAGKNFVFRIECLLDPEKPDDIYFGEIIRKD